MKITYFALALDIIIRFDRAVASFPTRPTFTSSNEDHDEASASVFASASSASAINFTLMTKEELIDNFISHDGEVEFSNITASPHYENCTRFFSGGYSMGYAYDENMTLTDVHLLPDEGIMLSSGNPLHFNSNDCYGQSTVWSWDDDLSDADLANVTNTTWGEYTMGIYDACFIEFDFKCSNQALTPTVSFKYMFGSDEYNEHANTAFTDAFAFILNGENIARLPTSESNTDVVSINNVNKEVNNEYFHSNDAIDGSMFYPQLEPDGFTVVLTAVGTPLQDPNEMNTIKIVVGDVGDPAIDSWVLLESGTFSCVDMESPDPCSKKSSKSGYSSKSSKGCYSTKSSKRRSKSTKYSNANLLAQEMISGASMVSNFVVVGFGVSIFAFLALSVVC